MRPFIEEFYERRRDVRRYLAVLVRAEQIMDGETLRKHDRELRMMRAGGILVLYNAIEASARSGIQAIYDEVEQTKTPFDSLRASFRKRVLKDFKKNFGIERHEEIKVIAANIVSASFDPRKIFSGNVDARLMRDHSLVFGFSCATTPSKTKGGIDLLTIKNKRNDLAHGDASFAEVGRSYTANDIKKIGLYSLNYMGEVLVKIDDYLDAGDYKTPPPED